jgi:hypothetical protein
MSGDTDRLIELAGELGQRLNSALGDVIPPEAQDHLLKAQKELLTALFLVYEHQLGARRRQPQPPAARTSRPRRASPAVRPRVQRIEIE